VQIILVVQRSFDEQRVDRRLERGGWIEKVKWENESDPSPRLHKHFQEFGCGFGIFKV